MITGTIFYPIIGKQQQAYSESDVRHKLRGQEQTVRSSLEHRNQNQQQQHTDQENLCLRIGDCENSGVGEHTLGNDNSVTGFADQSNNTQAEVSVLPVTPKQTTSTPPPGTPPVTPPPGTPPVTPPPGTPPVTPDEGVDPVRILSLGFESGDITHGWEWGSAQYQNGQPDRLTTVDKNSIQPPSIDPEGRNALKVTVQPNDIVSNGARAEVVLTNSLPGKNTHDFLPGEDSWYHWYTMFPNDLKIPNSWHIWTQLHQEADISSCPNPSNGGQPMPCGVIPLGFNFQNYPASHPGPGGSIGETLEFSVINKADVNTGDNPNGKGSGSDILWSAPLIRNHWYDILLHVNWEKCGSYSAGGVCTNQNGGFVEMWVDHKYVVPKTSHFTMDDDGTAYLKQGLYHCRISDTNSNCAHIDYSQTIYHDGMKVAECVTPDQPNRPPFFHPDTGKCYTTPPYS